MKHFVRFALVAALATPTFASDLLITTAKHSDAVKMMGQEMPAKDSTQTTWFSKDKLRMEDGDKVTIVRADLKKMFTINLSDKTYTAVDLPFDLKKYIPPEAAPMVEQMMSQMKITVTPTTETKKIKEWNATKYTMTMSGQMFTMTSDMWVTKDIKMDSAAFTEMHGSMMSLMPGGSAMVAELKKIEGFPVLTERTQTPMMGGEMKEKEEVTAVETKDAPEGTFDVPKDFKEVPFDPMSEMGGPGRGGKGPGRPGGGRPGAEKPKSPPVPK